MAARAKFASAVRKFSRPARSLYDPRVSSPRPRPGLAKTRAPPLVSTRSVLLWQTSSDAWRELIESADVMSEGAVKREAGVEVYYGTTSVVIRGEALARAVPPVKLQQLAAVAAADPHVRLRVLRVACLEAQLRAGGPLRRVHAEIDVRTIGRGIALTVDVEAPLQEHPRSGLPLPALTHRASSRQR